MRSAGDFFGWRDGVGLAGGTAAGAGVTNVVFASAGREVPALPRVSASPRPKAPASRSTAARAAPARLMPLQAVYRSCTTGTDVARALHAQEAAKGDARSKGADEEADADEDECRHGEAERVCIGIGEAFAPPLERGKRDLLGDEEEDDGGQ